VAYLSVGAGAPDVFGKQTASAERLALTIIDGISERCGYSRTSYEVSVALSSAP
jgi:hypothetical protein